MVTQEVLELPYSHSHTEGTATDRAFPMKGIQKQAKRLLYIR